ncbi:MAG: thiamine phosphate synthase [Mariprofundaceae bacterium]|nr:thiamine phosphate synthase [Mariprofundaceae bacterium]
MIQGIYGILPQDLPLTYLLTQARAALDGGVQTLQLRDKHLSLLARNERLAALHELMTAYDAQLIVNDRFSGLGGTGVHVGRDDFKDLSVLHQQCVDKILGVTCKGDLSFAAQALQAGADYISFGALYPTQSKQDVTPISLSLLAEARQRFPNANIVAIGGIQQHHFPEIRAAGVDAVAMIQGLFGVDHIESHAHGLLQAWKDAA